MDIGERFPVGIIAWPSDDWPAHARVWRHIEQLGATAGWLYDHVRWRGITPWSDAMSLLPAVAAITSTIGLGTLVCTPNFRHPLPVAHAARTIAHLSGGRFVLGVGAGSATSDAEILGGEVRTAADRLDSFEEWLDLLTALLAGEPVTREGVYWSVRDAVLSAGGPGLPAVPLTVAAGGPRGMRLVARHADAWVTLGDPARRDEPAYAEVRRQVRRLEKACAALGRDPAAVRRILVTGTGAEVWQRSCDGFSRLAERYRAIGITDFVLHWPSVHGRYPADRRVLERIIARHATAPIGAAVARLRTRSAVSLDSR